MEQDSPKLFNKYLIIVVFIVIAFTFYKSVFLRNFTVINTEPVLEEVVGDESQIFDSLVEEAVYESNTSTSTIPTLNESN